jgi:antitoxin FitA
MAAVTIRNIPEATHRALKLRAEKHSRSTEAEIRAILEAAAKPETIGLGTALYNLGRKFDGIELNIERDKSPIEPAVFD